MDKATLTPSVDLTSEQRKQILREFVYRWTSDNPERVRAWDRFGKCPLCDIREPYVSLECAAGHNHPTLPLVTDSEWLASRHFWVCENGVVVDPAVPNSIAEAGAVYLFDNDEVVEAVNG